MKTYEGMFLLDTGNPNFEETVAPVRAILGRYGAEVLVLKKWDERRLAYEIKGRRRGLYVLTYFKMDPLKITEVEHDIRLTEAIIRAMILTAEEVTPEQMAAATPAEYEGPRREYDDQGSDRYDRGDRYDRPYRREREDAPVSAIDADAPETEKPE